MTLRLEGHMYVYVDAYLLPTSHTHAHAHAHAHTHTHTHTHTHANTNTHAHTHTYTGRKYSSKCDVFSFGITMWEMITRKEPTFKLGPEADTMAVVFAVANGRWQY